MDSDDKSPTPIDLTEREQDLVQEAFSLGFQLAIEQVFVLLQDDIAFFNEADPDASRYGSFVLTSYLCELQVHLLAVQKGIPTKYRKDPPEMQQKMEQVLALTPLVLKHALEDRRNRAVLRDVIADMDAADLREES